MFSSFRLVVIFLNSYCSTLIPFNPSSFNVLFKHIFNAFDPLFLSPYTYSRAVSIYFAFLFLRRFTVAVKNSYRLFPCASQPALLWGRTSDADRPQCIRTDVYPMWYYRRRVVCDFSIPRDNLPRRRQRRTRSCRSPRRRPRAECHRMSDREKDSRSNRRRPYLRPVQR